LIGSDPPGWRLVLVVQYTSAAISTKYLAPSNIYGLVEAKEARVFSQQEPDKDSNWSIADCFTDLVMAIICGRR
jgi:hypothetical protein